MNASDKKESLNSTLQFANEHIDRFIREGRITYSELAVMVDAIYRSTGVSGSSLLAYVLKVRGKQLFFEKGGYMLVADSAQGTTHRLPQKLRDLPFCFQNLVRVSELDSFVPLFVLPGYEQVLVKTIIWVKNEAQSDKGLKWLATLLNAYKHKAQTLTDSRHAVVCVPIIHTGRGNNRVCFVHLPASTFETLRQACTQHPDAFQLRFRHGFQTRNVEVEMVAPTVTKEAMMPEVSNFWQKYLEYSDRLCAQNATMERAVTEALTHTMISMQKSIPELSASLF